MDSRYVKRHCYQHHYHPQLAQPSFKISAPQEDEGDSSNGRFLRERPPVPVPSINFHHKPQTLDNHEKKISHCKTSIHQQTDHQQGKVPNTHNSKEVTPKTPRKGVPPRSPQLPTIRITTTQPEKRKMAACRNINNRKNSFNSEEPPRPRKYSSPHTASGPGVSNRPVPSKRRHIAPPLPPPLPPRVPLKILSISENDLLRNLEDRPPLPPKPAASLSHFPSKSEVELFSFSESVFFELTSRHNSFNSPPPLPPKVVARQPLQAIRRSTISLDEKSIFDRDFDFLSDMPNRRGTTGAESILRARYGGEKKNGCCTECSRDCIVDTPECLMDIFC